MGVGKEEGLSFAFGFLGDKARLLQYLHQAYLRDLNFRSKITRMTMICCGLEKSV